MTISVLLVYAAASVAAGLALYVALRNPVNTVSRLFSVSMALLALEVILSFMAHQAEQAEGFLLWYRAKMIVASLLPGSWLIFSLVYGRANYREILNRWKPAVITVFVIPIALITFFWGSWYSEHPSMDQAARWYLVLGWAGFVWSLAVIAGAILVLINLEQTLKYSVGRKRWQIKFMIIGVGALFGVCIYNNCLAILCNQVGTDTTFLNAGLLLAAVLFIAGSVLRDREMKIDLYLSHAFLNNSLTIFLISAYFIGVGLLAWLTRVWIGGNSIYLTAFLLFLAIMGLGSILLSGNLRFKRKRFVSRLFDRPQYDCQQIWSRFTEITSSLTTTQDLCHAVVNMVSETLECLSVSLWLVAEGKDTFEFGASTALSRDQVRNLRVTGDEGTELMLALWDLEMPVDFGTTGEDWARAFRENHSEALDEARIRYAVPLRAASRLIGVLTLGGRTHNSSLTLQDHELLKTIADQAASNLLNLRLAEQLHKAKTLEAMQMMSAFFMHDLKNLGSKLSLVTQNLPNHFDNPEFRKDAIQSVTQSVEKINNMCSRLSLLSERLEIHPKKVNFNQLVKDALKSIDGMMKVSVRCSLGKVTDLNIDSEQMQKVIVNILLNASEATVGGGEISVSTSYGGGWVEFTVSDTGCGMNREFIEARLFKPFQTTKPTGMGIGLFHCKTIVEAHGGRIEVQSKEERGSTFRVFLPAKAEQHCSAVAKVREVKEEYRTK